MAVLKCTLVLLTLRFYSASAFNVSINCQPKPLMINENEMRKISCNLTINGPFIHVDNFYISATILDGKVAVCHNCSKKFSFDEEEIFLFEFAISGGIVGWSHLVFCVKNEANESFELEEKLILGVLRADGSLQLAFTIIVTILIVINTFVMGLQLDWRVIISIFKKPIAPSIGLFCQFICMPVLSFVWGLLLLPGQPNLQFGLFAVGCAPGGGASNFWCILLGGNVDLSVTMTFISSVAALAMMPVWLLTLGKYMTAGSTIVIPFGNIIISLISLIIPCVAGIVWKHYRPHVEELSRRIIKPVTVTLVGIIIVFGTYANWYIFSLVTWKSLLCGMLLPWSGFTVGFGVAYLLRQGFTNALTVSVETGIQNAGISIILVSFTLPHPDSDLTLIMPICAVMLTPVPLVVAFMLKSIYDCCTRGGKRQPKFSPVSNGAEKSATVDALSEVFDVGAKTIIN